LRALLRTLEGLIEPLLAPTVLLMVGLRGDEASQPVEIILVADQHDARHCCVGCRARPAGTLA